MCLFIDVSWSQLEVWLDELELEQAWVQNMYHKINFKGNSARFNNYEIHNSWDYGKIIKGISLTN